MSRAFTVMAGSGWMNSAKCLHWAAIVLLPTFDI